MAEKRPKSATILLQIPSKKGKQVAEKIDLFASELWKAKPGLFRMRKNGKWLDLPCGRKRFYSLTQIARVIAELLGETEPALEYEGKPRLPHPSRVSVPHTSPDNICTHTGGWTMAPTHQGPNGRWYVWVRRFDETPKEFLVSELVWAKPKHEVTP